MPSPSRNPTLTGTIRRLGVELGCDARLQTADAGDEPDWLPWFRANAGINPTPRLRTSLKFYVERFKAFRRLLLDSSKFRPELRLPRIKANLLFSEYSSRR